MAKVFLHKTNTALLLFFLVFKLVVFRKENYWFNSTRLLRISLRRLLKDEK